MRSQNEYQGAFSAFYMINSTLESHCTHQSHLGGLFHTTPCSTTHLEWVHVNPLVVLFRQDPSSILSLCSRILLFWCSLSWIGATHSPVSGLELLYVFLNSIPPPPPFGAPKFCTVLYTPPSAWPPQEWVLIHSDRCFSISVGTAQPRIVLFFFILHSLDTFCVLLFFKQHSPCGTALFLIVAPLVHLNMLYCLSNPTLIHC